MINDSPYSLKTLAVFRTLYENSTTTKTARMLGITQSGVSRALGQLEKNIGLSLFIRQKNRLIPTPEAVEFYEEVTRLSNSLNELQHSIDALREFGASRVRIATVPGLAFGFVPKIVAAILKQNNNLNIYSDVMSSADVVHSIETGQFQVGFVTLPIINHQLQVDTIIKTKAICLMPKEHVLSNKKTIEISDLAGHHLIVPNQPNIAADRLLENISRDNVQISGKTESNIASICSLVKNGVGLSVINPITAKDLSYNELSMKPFIPTIHYSFGLIYKKNWRGNKLIKMIKDSCELEISLRKSVLN